MTDGRRPAAPTPAAADWHGRLGKRFIDWYYRARRRRSSPANVAWSVAIGIVIGCLPLYGLHLVLCLIVARLLRLNGPLAYLAAFINNPWTAPLLLYLELGLGQWVLTGRWLSLRPSELLDLRLGDVGLDLLIGSPLLGLIVGLPLGLVAYRAARHARADPDFTRLRDRTSARYAAEGIRIWETVRGKMQFDPVYRRLVESVALPEGARVLDLGCGRGIVPAMLRAGQELTAEGIWPPTWPPVPATLEITGIEVDGAAAAIAERSLRDEATIRTGDLTTVSLPPADVVLCIDLLHYLPPADQQKLLARAAAAVTDDGLLLVREVDAAAGSRAWFTRVQERFSSWLRGRWRQSLHYRPAAEWQTMLEALGFVVERDVLETGTPFANVLLRAHRARPS